MAKYDNLARVDYAVHGSAAVEPAYVPEPKRRTKSAPNKKTAHRRRLAANTVKRQKMVVAPFGVVGVLMAMTMLVLVIFGYAQVYQSASVVGDLEYELSSLNEENSKLSSEYNSSIDLKSIEARAKELGMQQPSERQIIALQVFAEDTVVVAQKSSSNPFVAAWEAIVETARGLWEYLS